MVEKIIIYEWKILFNAKHLSFHCHFEKYITLSILNVPHCRVMNWGILCLAAHFCMIIRHLLRSFHYNTICVFCMNRLYLYHHTKLSTFNLHTYKLITATQKTKQDFTIQKTIMQSLHRVRYVTDKTLTNVNVQQTNVAMTMFKFKIKKFKIIIFFW